MQPYKRRQFFVDKGFQGRVAVIIVLICTAGLIAELIVLNYLSYRSMEALRWKMFIDIERTGEIVFKHLVYTSAVTVTATVLALYVYLKSVVRKAAGPIYRLTRDIEMAADGNLSNDIWLRGEDHFKDTATELNTLVRTVRNDFVGVEEHIYRIGKSVDVLEYVMDKPVVAREKCTELIGHIDRLKKSRTFGKKPDA